MDELRRAWPSMAAPSYRFMHTSGSLGNGPEMLGAARSEAEDLVYGTSGHCSGPKRRLSRMVPMYEALGRILALVHLAPTTMPKRTIRFVPMFLLHYR